MDDDWSKFTELTLERLNKKNKERKVMIHKEISEPDAEVKESSSVFKERYDRKPVHLYAYLDEKDPYFYIPDYPRDGIEYQIRPHSHLSINKDGVSIFYLKTNMFPEGDGYRLYCDMPTDIAIVRECNVNDVTYILQGEINKLLKEYPEIEEDYPQIIYGPQEILIKNGKFRLDFENKEIWKNDEKIADGVIESVTCDMYSDVDGIFYEVLFTSNTDNVTFPSEFCEIDQVCQDPYILRSFYDEKDFREVLKAFIIDGGQYGLCRVVWHD